MGAKKTFFWENLTPDKLWYLVGLTTSDGCLINDGRHIDITASDYAFLKNIQTSLNISSHVSEKNKNRKNKSYHIQIGSVSFYAFLKSIGLFSNKSLTLGKVNVLREQFNHFLRGLIDGDGCIRNWIHPTNKCEQWSLRIYSGSPLFLEWLQKEIFEIYGARGKVYSNNKTHSVVLKYGKIAGQIILSACYSNNRLALQRKNTLAYKCFNTPKGWRKSKTIDL